MAERAQSKASELVVEREPGEASVLRLRGRLRRRDAAVLDTAVTAVLATDRAPLVIDIVDLDGDAAAVVDVLNDVAARRIPPGSVLVVRVASTGKNVPNDGFHTAILVEPMSATPTAVVRSGPLPAARAEASPGSPRREGRGFVASYGTGRQCNEPGCETSLSRYNERGVCFNHSSREH